jgi:hypothetical protein
VEDLAVRNRTRTYALTCALSLVVAVALSTRGSAATIAVFSTGFESGIPPEFSAPGCGVEAVQGYAGLGPVGRQFGGSLLRYTAVTLYPTTLTLRDLPPHTSVNVKTLLAVIDSWDGTELLEIRIDGALVFRHWFQLAVGDTTSYIPPPGTLLSAGTNLGFTFGSYHFRDRAYDLGADPSFNGIAHTADSLVVTWNLGAVSGPAASQWQGGGDESWGLDGVLVEVNETTVDVTPAAETPGLSLAGTWPNPVSAGAPAVRFSLPDAAPASLELVNVAGRVVARREVGELGAGAHVVGLEAASRLSPGLYFLRLTRGAEARVARTVVL